jgi:hypothetical protein
MSFEDMKKDELVAVAEQFAVDPTGTKATIIKHLDEEGVTFELYQNLINATSGEPKEADPIAEAEAKPAKKADGKEVLVQFTGLGSYTGPGIRASAKSPFVVVLESVADRLVEKNPRLFRYATERDAEQFYG